MLGWIVGITLLIVVAGFLIKAGVARYKVSQETTAEEPTQPSQSSQASRGGRHRAG